MTTEEMFYNLSKRNNIPKGLIVETIQMQWSKFCNIEPSHFTLDIIIGKLVEMVIEYCPIGPATKTLQNVLIESEFSPKRGYTTSKDSEYIIQRLLSCLGAISDDYFYKRWHGENKL